MKKTGFTLLELLIVVVIVGILASLAIPRFSKTMERAKGRQAVAVLQTIRAAELMYYLDHGYYSSTQPERTDFFDELVPAYLPEDPNALFLLGARSNNWFYEFVGSPYLELYATRSGSGRYANQRINMDINGNLVAGWPWPPW